MNLYKSAHYVWDMYLLFIKQIVHFGYGSLIVL